MKKLLIFVSVAILAFSLAGCGGDKSADTKSDDTNTVSEETSTEENSSDDSSALTGVSVPTITNDEINNMSDNQFYVANAMSKSVTEIYTAVANSGEWSSNYVSTPIESGSRNLFVLENLDTSVKYDIKVVSDGGETTEYYGFDMKATVQITLYDNAQCDVATV